jgi:tetratricopeptide (TPR) repeat protein
MPPLKMRESVQPPEQRRKNECFRPRAMNNFELAKTLFFSGLDNFQHGDYLSAERNFRESLKNIPDRVSTLTNLAGTLIKLNKLSEAKELCLKAISIDENSAESWLNLGLIDKEQFNFSDAEKQFRQAININPDYAEAHNNLGMVLKDLGQLDDAVASIQRAIEINSGFADAHSNLGALFMALGKTNEAERSLDRGMELAPGDARPLATALLYLPYRQDDPRFSQFDSIYARRESLAPDDRIQLNFSVGKAMESIGQYDRAFGAYEEGNRLHYQAHPFDEREDERFLEKSCGLFNADLFMKYAAAADSLPAVQDERVPIFIVGMPRSGTTLIEQILASHPGLFGAGELSAMGELAGKAERGPFDWADCETTLVALRKLGQEYLDRVWELAPGARYITDKMPGNYHFLGWIHLMLPNAKIIHSMRNPVDTCFSCYALKFNRGHEYSYDLEALGKHYLHYRKFMAHWHGVLPPGRILDVCYENVIADTEREAMRILDYLGLPWDPACLRFHENTRAVRTASVAQVRKPIYTTSVARWKHFEKHLLPLIEILKPVCDLPGTT